MKRLWLASMPENYNPRKDILLGPWCVLGKENQYPDLSKLVFEPDPFDSFEEMKYAAKLTRYYAEYYLSVLAEQLNKKSNIQYSLKFWRIFLMPWLLPLTQITWLKQKIINGVISKYENDDISVELIADDIDWNFVDIFDFFKNGAQNVNFNHWLFSRLLERKVPDNWKIYYSEFKPIKKYKIESKDTLKIRMKRKFESILPIFSVEGVKILDALILEIVIKLKSLLLKNTNVINNNHKYDDIKMDWNLDWDSLVFNTLPKSFNDINPNRNKISKWERLIILSFSSLYNNDKRREKIAISVEHGAKLIATQHGGCYGTHLVHSRPAAIEFKNSSFISWGWDKTSYSGNNIIPACSPLLSKKVYRQDSNKMIFVNSSFEIFQKRIDSSRQPNEQIHAREDLVKFFNHLRYEILGDSIFRPFHYNSTSLDDRGYIKRNLPNMNILKGDLHDELMKCKLLVLNAPNTTFNIAMATNIPTISFWDQQDWGFDPIAKQYYDKLSDLGIIYDNPIDAAKKVNTIWDDVNNWWQLPSIQKARCDWAWNYARTSKHWQREWIKVIWNL